MKSKSVKVLVTQSHLTLGKPIDCGPSGSSDHGILHTRIFQCVPFPSPGDLLHSVFKPRFSALQADSLLFEPPGKPSELSINPQIKKNLW